MAVRIYYRGSRQPVSEGAHLCFRIGTELMIQCDGVYGVPNRVTLAYEDRKGKPHSVVLACTPFVPSQAHNIGDLEEAQDRDEEAALGQGVLYTAVLHAPRLGRSAVRKVRFVVNTTRRETLYSALFKNIVRQNKRQRNSGGGSSSAPSLLLSSRSESQSPTTSQGDASNVDEEDMEMSSDLSSCPLSSRSSFSSTPSLEDSNLSVLSYPITQLLSGSDCYDNGNGENAYSFPGPVNPLRRDVQHFLNDGGHQSFVPARILQEATHAPWNAIEYVTTDLAPSAEDGVDEMSFKLRLNHQLALLLLHGT